jgi:T5SS/PEP-CTERM-associated repeat protein
VPPAYWSNIGNLTVDASGTGNLAITGGIVTSAESYLGVNNGATDITGTFATVNVTDVPTTHDFLVLDAYRANPLADPAVYRDYVLAAGLAWNTGTDRSHGNFTLGANETFTVDTNLATRASHGGGAAWDGKSLTVTATNADTLILCATNTLGDVRVRGGDLVVTGSTTGATGVISSVATATIGPTAVAPTITVSDGGYWGLNSDLTVGFATGSVTVTSGLWENANLYVGYTGTGFLTIDGGTVSNSARLIGANSGASGGL